MEVLNKIENKNFAIRIVIYTALWGRFDIAKQCFKGLVRLANYDPKRFDIKIVAVYSEPEFKPICESYGMDCVYNENDPLGAKKNHGLQYILDNYKDFDYIFEIGSDDVVSNTIFDIYEPFYRQKVPVLNINCVYFWHVNLHKKAIWSGDTSVGGCRSFHRSVFDNLGKRYKVRFLNSCSGPELSAPKGKEMVLTQKACERFKGLIEIIDDVDFKNEDQGLLWPNSINRSLDGKSNWYLERNGYVRTTVNIDKEPYIVGMKSESNIQQWEHCYFDMLPDNADIFRHIPAIEAEAILKLRPKKRIKSAKTKQYTNQ